MKAVAFTKYGPPDVLTTVTVPKPTPLPKDLLVQVKAVSVNPIDEKVRTNFLRYPDPTEPQILGFDGAGIVVQLGNEVKGFAVGDEVFFAGTLGRPGSNAQFLAIDHRIVGKKPKKFTFEQAAAEPLTALTAFEALLEGLRIPENKAENASKTILILGGAGGAGSIGIELAKKVLGLKTIATASRPETIEFCKKMGADFVIDHHKPLPEQITQLGISGIEYVYICSPPNEQVFNQLIKICKPFARICTIIGNYPQSTPIQLWDFLTKRLELVGEYMFTRSVHDIEPERQSKVLNRVAELVDNGTFVDRSTATYDSLWQHIVTAHRDIESGRTIGKIVLRVD
jgi:zinc-binding alcohol dehydrogenase family protein